MSTRNYLQTLNAGDVIRLPAGRFFYIRTAASALDLETEGVGAAPVRMIGIGAGSKFGPVPEEQRWTYLKVSSAAAQNIEILISDDGLFDVANTVTVSGAVSVSSIPSAALADTVDNAQASASQTAIAANLSRRRITIGVTSQSNNSVRVSQAGGAGRGIEIQPGTAYTFETTAAMFVRNDNTFATGATATWFALEES